MFALLSLSKGTILKVLLKKVKPNCREKNLCSITLVHILNSVDELGQLFI